MITGEHAQPQPLEEFAPAVEPMPEAALKREALLHIFRWVFLVHGLVGIWISGQLLVNLISQGRTPEFDWLLIVLPMVYQMTMTPGLFWALSRPREWSRPILLAGSFGALIAATFQGWMVFQFSTVFGFNTLSRLQLPYHVVNQFSNLPEYTAMWLITILAYTGPGVLLYGTEGITHFERHENPWRNRLWWIPVVYALFVIFRAVGLVKLMEQMPTLF